MSEQSSSNPLKTFLAGAAIGAGAAILFAPRSGEQTREKLREWSEQARNSVEEGGQGLADRIRNLRRDLENVSTETLASSQKRVRDELEALIAALDEGRRVFQEERQRRSGDRQVQQTEVTPEIGAEDET